MTSVSLVLLGLLGIVNADVGKPSSSEHPPQGGDPGARAAVPPVADVRPETEWLTLERLTEMLKVMGHSPVQEDGRISIAVAGPAEEGGAERRMSVEWGDMDSLKMVSAWTSPQKGLEDAPIVNKWNNERRFCKVSISSGDEGNTLLVMHMDQLVYADEGPAEPGAVQNVVTRAVDTFRAGVLEFDKFAKDTYKAWAEEIQRRKSGDEEQL